ncbi:hypothetical protein [Vibrio coralliilyticus]|nr:hypothetical protein [Vibrio coralliilyticus]WFB50378.1 hypothetical protein P6988_17870 [Vibrio coralliilyticus]
MNHPKPRRIVKKRVRRSLLEEVSIWSRKQGHREWVVANPQ